MLGDVKGCQEKIIVGLWFLRRVLKSVLIFKEGGVKTD
jgi:hypothetical protein